MRLYSNELKIIFGRLSTYLTFFPLAKFIDFSDQDKTQHEDVHTHIYL